MTEIKQNGLVISEYDLGENDKILNVLTEKFGKLTVIAKGAKSIKNRHMPCCQLFSYASFGLRKKGNYYYITDSDLIENYYDIRSDVLKLSLATYLCDVTRDVTQEGNNDDEILRLMLNMLFAIAKDKCTLEIIRAVFQIRLSYELGFCPNLEECCSCHSKEDSLYFFDIIDGVMKCQKCKNNSIFIEETPFTEKGLNKPISIISRSVVDAFNYISFAKQERILSFNLDVSEWTSFFEVSEKYLLNHLERGFFSLDFYKSLLV